MVKYIVKNKAGEWLGNPYYWHVFNNIDECFLHDFVSLEKIKQSAIRDNWSCKPVEAFEIKILRAPTGEVKRL